MQCINLVIYASNLFMIKLNSWIKQFIVDPVIKQGK